MVFWASVAFPATDPNFDIYLNSLGPDAPSNDRRNFSLPESSERPELEFRRNGLFPVPDKLRPRVGFWKKIYSEFTTSQVVIHDKDDLSVIYEVVDLKEKFRNPRPGSRSVRRYLKNRRSHIASTLRKLYNNKGRARTNEEREIAAKWSHAGGYKKYGTAARKVRSQLGQADRFMEGLRRSGFYLKKMKSIFRSYGLPEELCALPHVESSFNYNAYSSAGAAGIWQFTRGTGRLFMKINYTVDERRDPIFSTHAAAKLLALNYEKLKSWPLAITAYNHGLNGMTRAKRKHGSDIVGVIENYRSRSFGFASQNFYAEFLAAMEVAGDWRRHFGNLDFHSELMFNEVRMPFYASAASVSSHLEVPMDTLKEYNRSLRNSVFRGHRHIPKGFLLRVPHTIGSLDAKRMLASLPSPHRHASQKHNGFHIVRRGDTLSTIARNYRSSVGAIKDLNGIHSHIIRVGQRLRIPGKRAGYAMPGAASAVVRGDGGVYYRVRKGDNLTVIAARNNVPLDELLQLNGLSKRSTIHPGQKLVLSNGSPGVKNAVFVRESAPVSPTTKGPDTAPTKDAQQPVISNYGESVKVGDRVLRLKVSDFAIRMAGRDMAKVTVKSEETLGHYAEWARVGLRSVLRANNRRSSRGIRIGNVIKVPMRVSREKFEKKRMEYHMQLLEDFFDAYKVEDEKKVIVKRKQSLWDLCVNGHNTPLWLVELYNPGVELENVRPGEYIIVPAITRK